MTKSISWSMHTISSQKVTKQVLKKKKNIRKRGALKMNKKTELGESKLTIYESSYWDKKNNFSILQFFLTL